MSTSSLCTEWLELPDNLITFDNIDHVLRAIPDDAWVAAAATDRIVDDVDVQRTLLALGLEKTATAVERSRKVMSSLVPPLGGEEEDVAAQTEAQLRHTSLVTHFAVHTTDELLCRLRAILLGRLDRLDTYVELSKQLMKGKTSATDEPADAWDDLDPWEDSDEAQEAESKESSNKIFDLSLSSFLRQNLLHTALFLASNLHFSALVILFQRHAKTLNAHRLHILQFIPEHVHPTEFHMLLPAIDPSTEVETLLPDVPWRDVPDWTETEECTSAFGQTDATPPSPVPNKPHSVKEVKQWYRDRIDQAEQAGLVDVALALVQHGASQGVPDLDEVGEELGLLARLVYDARRPEIEIPDDGWTLFRWKSLESSAAVRAYLTYSTPETIAGDIRRLVMPYLYVLESRAERAGTPDPGLVNRIFYDYVLQSPIELVAAIFDASKPTLAVSARLIKKDEDMARLALACLYGSDILEEWTTMSRIFECLPAWGEIDGVERDEADTTLMSLGGFVTPSTKKPRCTPQELFLFFSPLPASALSRVLDVLDVHLESGEILARWNVPAPLRWFLQSAKDETQQRAWATRMSRHAGGGGDELETEGDWLELLEDMLKLIGNGEGAFGLLTQEEVTRIFFSGLLSSGNFQIAKSVLRKSRTPYLSDMKFIEQQVLASSREFYDNSSTGNLHQGDMKLAYDCLTVGPLSSAIQAEREFIEATSRICSFNVVSRPGIPISPIEIRLVKDRLSLVARVLSSTEDAYKHSRVILDLVHKLGYRDDVAAEVKVLAMLADAAFQAEDFIRAAETAERMVEMIRNAPSSDTDKLYEAREVCWHSCFQLGRQTEFHDVDKKLNLLGHALEICPPEHMLDVLSVWRKIENENMMMRREKLVSLKENASSRKRKTPPSATASFRTRLQELQLGSSTGITAPDAAALASRTFKTVAANFPFSVRGRHAEEGRSSWDGEGGHKEAGGGPDVSAHAKQAFARGIGWLIGADEQ